MEITTKGYLLAPIKSVTSPVINAPSKVPVSKKTTTSEISKLLIFACFAKYKGSHIMRP